MERHNIRAEHGLFAGRFISRKRKQWRENVLAAKRKKPNEPTVHSDFTHADHRVVELGFLAEELWCKQCNVPLSLRNIEAEITRGLARVLDVRCLGCNILKKVSTGKSNCRDTHRNRRKKAMEDDDNRTHGFKRGLEADKILGSADDNGELMYLIQWKGTDVVDMVSAKEANAKCPQIVIQFYENRTIWSKSKA